MSCRDPEFHAEIAELVRRVQAGWRPLPLMSLQRARFAGRYPAVLHQEMPALDDELDEIWRRVEGLYR